MSAKVFVRAMVILSLCSAAIATQASADELCNNGNIYGTLNNPPRHTTPCRLNGAAHITKLFTYHWNDGRGSPAGEIYLENSDTGRQYGPFAVTATSGQGGAPNVNWTAYVDLTVPAGTYEVSDSDHDSWSWNQASQGHGFITVTGELVRGDDESDDDSGRPTDGDTHGNRGHHHQNSGGD